MKKKIAKKKSVKNKMTILNKNGVSTFKPHGPDRRKTLRFNYFIMGTSKNKINSKSGLLSGDDTITDNIDEALPFSTYEEVSTRIKTLKKSYSNYIWTQLMRPVL